MSTHSSVQWLDAFVARLGRKFVIGVPMLFLLAVFALPFLVVFKISVSESDGVRFVDLLTWSEGVLQLKVRFSNYLYILFEDSLYIEAYLSSIKYAALTTAICLAIGYPFAYFLARSRPEIRPGLLMLVMLPFWTSFLLRVYAFIVGGHHARQIFYIPFWNMAWWKDIFEEIEPTEPASLEARIRAGEEVDPDELEDEDWDSQKNHLEHLEGLKQTKPPTSGD